MISPKTDNDITELAARTEYFTQWAGDNHTQVSDGR